MEKPTIDLAVLIYKLQMELLTKQKLTPEELLSNVAEHFKETPRILDIAMGLANEAIKESYTCCDQHPKGVTDYDFETQTCSLIAYREACKKDTVI